MLVCLLLVAVLVRWVDRPDARWSFLAGLLCGLTAVLKPEIMFAGGIVMLTGFLLHGCRHGWPRAAVWVAWISGFTLPSGVFFVYFLFHFSLGEALAATGNAWLSAKSAAHVSNP